MVIEYVSAVFRPGKAPLLWNYHDSMAEAEATAAIVRGENEYPGAEVLAMTYADYEARDAAETLARPFKEITAERFDEMLNVLPPMAWQRHGSWERFLMCEFEHGTFTTQFLRVGDRHFEKVVNARDQSTWLTPQAVGFR